MITANDLLRAPLTDPELLYRYRDGLYAVDMLTAAISHLDFFNWLDTHPSDQATICRSLGLANRPVDVMLTLLAAMGLVRKEAEIYFLTALAKEHLCATSPWFLAPYFDSVKERPVCLDIVEVLRTGKPATWASLRHEKEWAKAMEGQDFANRFTAAMDSRGIYLAPALAERLNCSGYHHLLDIAGGSGIYACAMVARHSHLRATVLEKPPVDRIAEETITNRGFGGKVRVARGDIFQDPLPAGCDLHLFSNVLHDWDVPLVLQLLRSSSAALPSGGMIVIHDAHINASKTGPLPVAAYSALLMTITEGKCYSELEMTEFLTQTGFSQVNYFPTVADRSIVTARKL